MAKTEFYQIQSARDLDDLRQQMNQFLLKLSNRIDRLEGIRGTSTIENGLTIETSDQIVHGFNTTEEV